MHGFFSIPIFISDGNRNRNVVMLIYITGISVFQCLIQLFLLSKCPNQQNSGCQIYPKVKLQCGTVNNQFLLSKASARNIHNSVPVFPSLPRANPDF